MVQNLTNVIDPGAKPLHDMLVHSKLPLREHTGDSREIKDETEGGRISGAAYLHAKTFF